ncbi:hypothetical protein L9F63_017459, partial [Diploptera punctata]
MKDNVILFKTSTATVIIRVITSLIFWSLQNNGVIQVRVPTYYEIVPKLSKTFLPFT